MQFSVGKSMQNLRANIHNYEKKNKYTEIYNIDIRALSVYYDNFSYDLP